jgi:hypothetical protein
MAEMAVLLQAIFIGAVQFIGTISVLAMVSHQNF